MFDVIGCKALLYAVLERAILDYAGKHEDKDWLTNGYQRKARAWILGSRKGDIERPMTFDWVCDNLDLDPNQIRRAIKTLLKLNGPIKHTARRHRAIGFSLFENCPTATMAEVYFL